MVHFEDIEQILSKKAKVIEEFTKRVRNRDKAIDELAEKEKETHSSKNLECHLCEIHCERSSDLKKHLVTHSYKEIRCKCEECDFVGLNEVTMEVHLWKLHSEKFECGLCDLEAGF